MNIREWFGFRKQYHPNGETDRCLDSLLSLYSKALTQYFSASDVQNVNHLIEILSQRHLSRSENLFFDWLTSKGLHMLESISSKSLPNDNQLTAKIEYERFILEEEMDFEFPEDVRASLINIASELPEIIAAALEASVSITEDWLTSLFTEFDFLENVVDEKSEYFQQENEYVMLNYRESVDKTGSFFILFFSGGKYVSI
jgi:hypothetical protein